MNIFIKRFKELFKIEVLSDIRFWIILFFILRLYAITSPPLEHSHNWRQTTGLSVARNFYEIDNNILYPRVDDNNGYSGIVGMEFPVLNYMMYLLSKIFGFHEWYGRLLNLTFSSIGIWYFFLLIRKFFNSQVAFFSSLILISSIWFMFSRKMMHDTFCISFTFIGLWYGLNYLFEGKFRNFVLYFVFLLFGVLSKIPAAYLLVIFILPLFSSNVAIRRKLGLIISLSVIGSAVYFWYFIWNPYLSSEYHLWYNNGKSFKEGFIDIITNKSLVFEHFYFDSLKSYTGLLLVFVGIFYVIKTKNILAKRLFILLTLFFCLYMFKSGTFFSQHDHYIIPFVPVMALMGGFGLFYLSQINKKAGLFIISILVVEAVINQQHDFTNVVDVYKLNLEKISDSFSEKSDLIAVNGLGNPQDLYLSHRKGWTIFNEQITDTAFINSIKVLGCKFIYVNKHEYKLEIPAYYKKVYDDEHYTVLSLKE